ncbi:MAG: response regulator transcription factor [Cyanobacteriota/Melainabacteria group bacterium]
MTEKRALIIEDDPDVAATLVDILGLDGFTVDSTESGSEGKAYADVGYYDLIVLDWGLPDTTGIEVLKHFREKNIDTPILMLTARSQDEDKESGLLGGADDYLTKPFSIKELRARIVALMRRRGSYAGFSLQFRHCKVDLKSREVTVDGKSVSLLPKEFSLLTMFLQNQNRVFSLDDLVNRLWDGEEGASYDAVRQCVKRLRKKVDIDGSPSIITTIVGVGYKIEKE